MKKLLVAFVVVLGAFAIADENVPPTGKITLPKVVSSKAVTKGTVSISFAEGLHGYQNPPTRDWMIPVTVVSDTKGVTVVKAIYPKGVMKDTLGDRLAVYEGDVKIPVQLKFTGKKGPLTVKLKIKYQQCTETGCFPPSTISVYQKVTLK